MKIWMDVMRDLEHLMDDHEALFDGWQAGGVEWGCSREKRD